MAPLFTGLKFGFGRGDVLGGPTGPLEIFATGVSIPVANNFMINVNSNNTGVLQYNYSSAYYTTDGGATWSSWSLPAAINSNNGRYMGVPAPNGNHWFLTDMDNNGGGRQIVHYASTVGGSWTKIVDFSVSREDQCYYLAADNSGNAAGLTGNNTNNGRGFNVNSAGTYSYVGSYVYTGGPGGITWTGTSGRYVQATQYRGLVTTTDSWANYSTVESTSHPSVFFGRDSNTDNWIAHITSGTTTNFDIYVRYNGVVSNISSTLGISGTGGSYFNRYTVSTKAGIYYIHDRSSPSNNFQIYSGASGTVTSTTTVSSSYIKLITDSGDSLYIPTA